MAAPAVPRHTLVADLMRPGILSCSPETPLREVARMMAVHRIHCVVVTGLESRHGADRPVWGIVSDLDVARAAGGWTEATTAGEIAGTEIVTVSPADTVEHAAALMGEHETAHLLVVDDRSREPTGVISTLDVARVIAGLLPASPAAA